MQAYSIGMKSFGSGKWYAEVLIESSSNDEFAVGNFANQVGPANRPDASNFGIKMTPVPETPGSFAVEMLFYDPGNFESSVQTGAVITSSDFPLRIGIAVDADQGYAWASWNGNWIDYSQNLSSSQDINAVSPFIFTTQPNQHTLIQARTNSIENSTRFTILPQAEHIHRPSGFQPWNGLDLPFDPCLSLDAGTVESFVVNTNMNASNFNIVFDWAVGYRVLNVLVDGGNANSNFGQYDFSNSIQHDNIPQSGTHCAEVRFYMYNGSNSWFYADFEFNSNPAFSNISNPYFSYNLRQQYKTFAVRMHAEDGNLIFISPVQHDIGKYPGFPEFV